MQMNCSLMAANKHHKKLTLTVSFQELSGKTDFYPPIRKVNKELLCLPVDEQV